MKLTKTCPVCEQIFAKQVNESNKVWNERRSFCSKLCAGKFKVGRKIHHLSSHQFSKGSTPWNKGSKDPVSAERMKNFNPMHRPDIRLKSSETHKGKLLSTETRLKMSDAQRQVVAGGRHNFYVDGRGSMNKKMRNSVQSKIWREAVFKRDDWTCQSCKRRAVHLQAHHLKSWSEFPELRFEVANGVSLCKPCHELTDSYPKQLVKNSCP